MRFGRGVRLRIPAPKRWRLSAEGVMLSTGWVALGIYTVAFLFFVPGADRKGIMFNSLLLVAFLTVWTFFYFTWEEWPRLKWFKKKGALPPSEATEWQNEEDLYRLPSWIKSEDFTEQDVAGNTPWLTSSGSGEEYDLQIEPHRPKRRNIQGPIRDDP